MWGATLRVTKYLLMFHISIHAPRVGSDLFSHPICQQRKNFNPRSPCGERRCFALRCAVCVCISIHAPRVGSDSQTNTAAARCRDFNPRSPCGERQTVNTDSYEDIVFQSTLPVWGATICFACCCVPINISIHAPRVGSDLFGLERYNASKAISIHAPRVGSDGRR